MIRSPPPPVPPNSCTNSAGQPTHGLRMRCPPSRGGRVLCHLGHGPPRPILAHYQYYPSLPGEEAEDPGNLTSHPGLRRARPVGQARGIGGAPPGRCGDQAHPSKQLIRSCRVWRKDKVKVETKATVNMTVDVKAHIDAKVQVEAHVEAS